MNATLGWALAGAALVLGWLQHGWRGLALAMTVIVFWLLLQFGRALRALRVAGQSPVGQVASAVMLHAGLRRGARLVEVIRLAGSLGRRQADEPETWAWTDASGASVSVVLRGGRVSDWTLMRPATAGRDAHGEAAP